MLDHDDGREPVQSPDKLDRLEHLIARHSGCGFVEQRQDRIGREQHPQFHPLAMRVGQCVDLQIEPRRFVEANLVQDRRYRAFKFVSAMQAPPGDRDIFANAQPAIDAGDLIFDRDTHSGDLARMRADDTSAPQQNIAAGGAQLARHTLEQRTLAGAVRADKAAQLTFGDCQVDIVHGRYTAEAAGEPARFQYWRGAHVRRSINCSARNRTLMTRTIDTREFAASRSDDRMPRGTKSTKKMMMAPKTSDVFKTWLVPRNV